MRIDVTLPEVAVPGQHGVYVCFDGDGDVLYIGRTMNLFARIKAHRSSASWFKRMRSLEFTACDGPNEARDLEKSLIEEFHPAANINDFRPQQTSSRQRLPAWTVAKLVTMYEACVASHWDAADNERLNNYILALREARWTRAAIGEGLRMTREGVRIRARAATKADASPGIPAVPVKAKPVKVSKPTIPADVLKVMLDLQAQARQVNGVTPLDSPLRQASTRYSEMIADQLTRGVTIYRMSQQLGVTHLGIKARLARHGYINNLNYMPQVPFEERAWKAPTTWTDTCRRGHDVTGDNVRLINGDPSRRICKACERIRSDKWRAKAGKPVSAVSPIREWAVANGIPIGRTGTIPARVMALYEAAQREAAA